MCLYFTCKYTRCGCIIYDDRSTRCESQLRKWCPGAEIIQTEFEQGNCLDCLGKLPVDGAVDDYEGERQSEPASSSSSLSASVGSKGAGEDGGNEREDKGLETAKHVKYMQCDASRVCDPVVFKRGSRVRRRNIHDKATEE